MLGHCFSHSGAKVAVLTDGWIYRVFADHDARGLLDTRSFASFAIDAPDDEAIRVLGLLSREGFDHDAIRALAALRLASKGSLGMGGRPLRGSPQSERFVVAMRGQFRDQVESLRMLIRKHKGVDLCDLNRVVQWAIEDSLKRLAEQKPTEPR